MYYFYNQNKHILLISKIHFFPNCDKCETFRKEWYSFIMQNRRYFIQSYLCAIIELKAKILWEVALLLQIMLNKISELSIEPRDK